MSVTSVPPRGFIAEMFFLPEGEVWRQLAGAYRRCGARTG